MKVTYYSPLTEHEYPTASHRRKAEEKYIRTLDGLEKEQTAEFLRMLVVDCEYLLEEFGTEIIDLDAKADEVCGQDEIDLIEENIKELEDEFTDWENRLYEFKHLQNFFQKPIDK